MNKSVKQFINGLWKENPTFVLMLGMCPTLAVTTSAINGLGMGLTTTVVLVLSNAMISLLRKIIPQSVRIPAYIVLIASFVTILELVLEGYLPFLYDSLGIYIPLIVVNCIILGRAEAFASQNPVLPSIADGLGMGLGFSLSLTCIGLVRELIGAGQIFGVDIGKAMISLLHLGKYGQSLPHYEPIRIFVMAPGAFFVLAVLSALQNVAKENGKKKGKDVSKIGSGCSEDCMNCGQNTGGCHQAFYDEGKEVKTNA